MIECDVRDDGLVHVYHARGALPGQVVMFDAEDLEKLEEKLQDLKLQALANTLVLEEVTG